MRHIRRHLGLGLVCAAFAASLIMVTGCRQHDTAERATPASEDLAGKRVAPAPTGMSKVTVGQVQQWMDEGRPLAFVDSRSDGSWRAATTKAPGAIRVPPHDVESHLDSIPLDRTIVVYCT